MKEWFDPHDIDEKWQRKWSEAKIFEPEPDDRKKFFITIPYPYLNGNLHAGHTRTFTIGDVIARYKRMLGYNVLFPMGFHATGTPIVGLAEQIRNKDPETIRVYNQLHQIPLDILHDQIDAVRLSFFGNLVIRKVRSVLQNVIPGESMNLAEVVICALPKRQLFGCLNNAKLQTDVIDLSPC